MGNILTFSNLRIYQEEESVAFSILFLVLLVIVVALSVYMCLGGCQCIKKNWCGEKSKSITHTVLGIFFPNLIKKKIYVQTAKDRTIIAMDVDDSDVKEEFQPTKEVYLFGDNELIENVQDMHIPSWVANRRWVGKDCLHCCVYLYFIVIVVLACIWFLVMAVENAIYRKTGTCNDINVLDNSFTCFDLDNHSQPINCSVGKSPNITVFCYLFSPNPGAIGIAFSTVNAILFAVIVNFKVTNKLARKRCCRGTLLVLQIAATIVSVLVTVLLLPLLQFQFKIQLYFFHGNAAMRWAMYFLTIFTSCALILMPWCFFTTDDKYEDMVLDTHRPTSLTNTIDTPVVTNVRTPTPPSQGQSAPTDGHLQDNRSTESSQQLHPAPLKSHASNPTSPEGEQTPAETGVATLKVQQRLSQRHSAPSDNRQSPKRERPPPKAANFLASLPVLEQRESKAVALNVSEEGSRTSTNASLSLSHISLKSLPLLESHASNPASPEGEQTPAKTGVATLKVQQRLSQRHSAPSDNRQSPKQERAPPKAANVMASLPVLEQRESKAAALNVSEEGSRTSTNASLSLSHISLKSPPSLESHASNPASPEGERTLDKTGVATLKVQQRLSQRHSAPSDNRQSPKRERAPPKAANIVASLPVLEQRESKAAALNVSEEGSHTSTNASLHISLRSLSSSPQNASPSGV